MIESQQQPSASELVAHVEKQVGLEARWVLSDVINILVEYSGLTRSNREYLRSLTVGGNLAKALRGDEAPDREAISSSDYLLDPPKQTYVTIGRTAAVIVAAECRRKSRAC